MKKILGCTLAIVGAALIASCGQAASPLGPQAATSAAELQQTAVVAAPTLQVQAGTLQQTAQALAPTLQAQAGTLQQTAQALATQSPIDLGAAQQTAQALLPTIQAQAPELRSTLEALATQVPDGGAGALQTLQTLTGGMAGPAGIPVAQPSTVIVSSPTHLTYTTTQIPADVIALYKKEMAAAGWTEAANSVTANDMGQLRFQMNGQTAVVNIARVGESTTVDVAIEGA
jgi:hypothetical protein